MLERKKVQRIKFIIAIVVVLLVAIIVFLRVSKYQKEGEKNMPYSISKIIVVSTASKYEKNTEVSENPDNTEETSEQVDTENQSDEEQSGEEVNTEEQSSDEVNTENQPVENQTNEGQDSEVQDGQETSNEEQVIEEEIQDNSVWKFDVIQTSDIYISIEKNEENIKKDEKIKSVSIENIEVTEAPKRGSLKAYMPNSLDGEKYKYTDDYLVSNSLTYRASGEGDFKNLLISNNGGIIGISIANTELGTYTSGEDTEITYNGTMLSKLGITDEDVKSKISFDVVIELDDGKKYSGRASIDIPCDGLVENGTAQIELTDFSNVIFKRK